MIRMTQRRKNPLARLAALAVAMVLFASCSASTTITASGPALQATTESLPETTAPETLADTWTIPANWSHRTLDSYRIGIPRGWTIMTAADRIEDLIDQAGAPEADLLKTFQPLLSDGHALVAIGSLGDNVNAFRIEGDASMVAQPELLEEEFERQFAAMGDVIEVRATPRLLGDLSGMSVYASYSIGFQRAHMYQFSTVHDGNTYFFTLTLLSGEDQALADDLFQSIDFN